MPTPKNAFQILNLHPKNRIGFFCSLGTGGYFNIQVLNRKIGINKVFKFNFKYAIQF